MTTLRFSLLAFCAAVITPTGLSRAAPVPTSVPRHQPFDSIHGIGLPWPTISTPFGSVNCGDLPANTEAPKSLPPPFVLTAKEQTHLDKVLDDWERHSSQVNKFDCSFDRLVYDPTFLPPKSGPNGQLVERPIRSSCGEVEYSPPDKGVIRETIVNEIESPGTPAEKMVEHKYGDHWECDGKSLAYFDDKWRDVHRVPLPLEIQRKFSFDGPIFLAFAGKSAPLKARYYLREITSADKADESWLEIRPRYEKDLKRFVELDVIFRTIDMFPIAVRVTHAEVKIPIQTDKGTKLVVGQQRDVYVFHERRAIWPK
jgi:hypothetical protein